MLTYTVHSLVQAVNQEMGSSLLFILCGLLRRANMKNKKTREEKAKPHAPCNWEISRGRKGMYNCFIQGSKSRLDIPAAIIVPCRWILSLTRFCFKPSSHGQTCLVHCRCGVPIRLYLQSLRSNVPSTYNFGHSSHNGNA